MEEIAKKPSEATRPYFFFSYARKDRNDFLDQFYLDLRAELEGLGLDVENAGVFRDLDEISPGEDYDDQLARALQKSLTLVCIYSPWYFKRPYCWMEFQAFLDRQANLRYEEGMARGVRGIIPVLWRRPEDLAGWGLPPILVRKVQLTIDRINAYKESGLQGVMRREGRNEGSSYWEVLEEIARLILKEVREDPLPELPELPSAREAWTAAMTERQRPLSRAANQPLSNQVNPSNGDVFVCYATTGDLDEEPETWKPFPEECGDSIRLLLEEISADAGHRYIEHVVHVGEDIGSASDELLSALRTATLDNALTFLIVHPVLLRSGQMQPLISRLLDAGKWRGAVIVPSSATEASQYEEILQEAVDSEREVRMIGAVYSLRAFERRLLIMVNDLMRLLTAEAKVGRDLPADGPSSLPRLAGPRKKHGNDV